MSANSHNNKKKEMVEAAAAAAVPFLAPTRGLGASENTVFDRNTGRFYIDWYLREETPFGDDHIEEFNQLTLQHLEGDNMEKFINGFYTWLANTAVRTNQNTWLSSDKKNQYRKYAKQAIRERFSTHPLFTAAYGEWHADMEKKFKTQCDRSRQLDEHINEERKSESIYRDVSERGDNCTAIRVKYMGVKHYDCRTIAMNLLKESKDRNTASKLAEFNVSRAATARGGEHAFLRWDEGTYDPWYRAPDFDWTIIKQLERQCMFFFCDLSLYMICPYFGWAVYFLFGGLRRDDKEMGPTKNFVFPHLHSIKRNGVAERMTKAIRSAIDDETRKKAYTSRSTRKGQMGELRMNRDLSLTEQYAHSGHTFGNPNAEGYIEPNPAITAPGAMASAGYTNCHMRPCPHSFDVLGVDVFETVQRLVSEMFKNDMPRLQPGGNLRPVIMICAARLIGAYSDLIKDLGMDHIVVKSIMEASRQADVDDERVKSTSGPRYHVVLKEWSRQINEQHKKDNDQVSPDNPKVNEELLRVLIDRVEKLEASAAAREEWERNHFLALDQINIQKQELMHKDQKIKDQDKQIKKLQGMLYAAQQSSPRSPQQSSPSSPIRHDQIKQPHPLDDVDRKRPPAIILQQEFGPSSKKNKSASSTTASTQLDGVQNVLEEKKVGAITVEEELERMWNERVLSKKREELNGAEVPSKEVLFTRIHTDVHGNPTFKAGSEMSKYDAGMSFVAMAISDNDWKKLCTGELDDQTSRQLFNTIQKDTMLTACELERQFLKSGKAKENSQPTIHSLGTRLKACAKDKKETDKTFDMNDYVLRKATGKQGKQGNVLSYFVAKKK